MEAMRCKCHLVGKGPLVNSEKNCNHGIILFWDNTFSDDRRKKGHYRQEGDLR
jgi:hypothetical protein